MRASDVPRARTISLRLHPSHQATVAEVVAWHGAVQAQEYVQAKWSLAQRTRDLTPQDVDDALARGVIIRTHALRPTWHFLTRDDARWIMSLTGPRLQRGAARRYRELGLDAKTRARSERVVAKALAGGNYLTRAELSDVLEKNRIDTSDQRLHWFTAHLEFEQVICSGPPRGNRQTYAAFDEMVPPAKERDVEDATRELVRRYLQSHGPASVHDLQWWGGLRIGDIRAALDDLGDDVERTAVEGAELWSIVDEGRQRQVGATIRLLETYDEYVVGYTRTRFFGDPHGETANANWRTGSHRNVVTRNGLVIGHWKRVRTQKRTTIEVRLYETPSQRDTRELRAEVARFSSFYGTQVELEQSDL